MPAEPSSSGVPGAGAPVALTTASLAQRAIARCIDTVVLMLLVVGALAGFVDENADGNTQLDAPVWWIVLLLVGVLSYEIVPVHVRGQTPGKILTRTRVARIADGGNPTWVESTARWIVPAVVLFGLASVLGILVFPIVAVVYGTALLDRGGRSLLDKLAHTRVVQAK